VQLPPGVRAVVLDIEGTTTPISFVTEVLFPFARARLASTLARAGDEPEVAAATARLEQEWQAEAPPEVPSFADGTHYASYAMDRDRKSTGLKELQGLIWREGYESGELVSQVFEDVPPALEAWRGAGIRLGIFSSGSVLAQKLLFGHTDHGDLRKHFEHWTDTTTGPKREPSSYAAIAALFELAPGEILFLSDVPAELDAARAAGMRTGLLRRPGNAPVDACEHPSHTSLLELAPSA
jgi:enolase-phosphatase E1